MNKTQIETIKNPDGTQGYSWNPLSGCLYCTPDGMCLGGGFPCYARKLANTRLKERYLANKNLPAFTSADIPYGEISQMYIEKCFNDPFYPRFWPERLKELQDRHTHNNRFSKPIGVFVCDMSDLFGLGIPEEWTRQVLDVISKQMTYPAENDRLYLLTKQPQNLLAWSPFPDNCWLGVTATNYTMANDARYWLKQIKAKVKYLSIEPFLEPLHDRHGSMLNLLREGINWLIIGVCTGTKTEMEALIKRYPGLTLMPYGKKWTAQPKIEWIEEIVQAADKAGIPVFEKDNLRPLLGNNLRQKMP